LFTLKKKTDEEQLREDEEFKEFSLRKDKEPKGSQEADDIVARYWKADEDLDEGERFLRDYLLNKGWQETTSLQAQPEPAQMDDDSEEEEHLDDVDDFEKEYNFRFEVEEGRQIQGHARFPEASVRERPDKRKRQRKERAERKDAEKIRRTEELKRLKNLKKEEIKRRLQQLKEITGNDDTALGAVDLDDDFDPDTHDQDVTRLLGEDFDEKEETLAAAELMSTPIGCEADLDISTASQEAVERRKRRKNQGEDDCENEDEAEAGADDEEEAQPGLWFLCDACQCAIPGGKKRFDCTVCEDYVLCAKCFRVRRHPHKFVRRKVPERCVPPEDWKGKEADRADVQQTLDEYFQLDYEDIIGGDLPTRFKYRQVESQDFGLTAADILEKDDKELNRLVPLKKLRTYRNDPSFGSENNDDKNDERWKRKRQYAAQAASKPFKNNAGSSGLSAQRLGAYSLGDTRSSGKKQKR